MVTTNQVDHRMLFDIVEYIRIKVLKERRTILCGWDRNGDAVICTDFNLANVKLPGDKWIYSHYHEPRSKFIGYFSNGSCTIWVSPLYEVCALF